MEKWKRHGIKVYSKRRKTNGTESVEVAKKELEEQIDHLDLIINNAVTVSSDCDIEFFEANLDYIANTVNVTSVGAMRVIKAFYPMLKKSDDTALSKYRLANKDNVPVNLTKKPA